MIIYQIIDATGSVLGRLASHIAKELLLGKKIDVVNAEKALVNENSIPFYTHRRGRGSEHWGPFFPRRAERIFRRTVRGMLPFAQPRGRVAYKRFRTFISQPAHLTGKAEKVTGFEPKSKVHSLITLEELSKRL